MSERARPADGPRKQLIPLCDPAHPPIRGPFAAEWAGETWDCATAGRALLAIKGATWPARDDAPDVVKHVFSRYPPKRVPHTVGDLLEWSFGDGVWCVSCGGTSYTEGAEGEYPCSCDAGVPAVEVGSLGGVLFNRRLIYRHLLVAHSYDPFGVCSIQTTGEDGPIFIEPPGTEGRWLLAVMPLLRAGEDQKVTELEVSP